MSEHILSYGHQSICDDDVEAVVKVLRGDYLTQGPAIENFERALAERVGARYAVAVSSGTSALHAACLAAGMGPGRLGVTSTLTFVATANACLYCDGDAVAVDIDGYGLGMRPSSLKEALAQHADASVVLPVHYAGLACDAAEIRSIASGKVVIEDASHALGSSYADGKPIGSCTYADMTVFSFHPVKPITTGEGGAITTNDAELYRLLKLFANHGIERNPERFAHRALAFDGAMLNPWYYEQQKLGYNYRMSDIHAALGRAQLYKLDAFIGRRREIALHYDAAFSRLAEVTLPQSRSADRARSAHHLYPIIVNFDDLGTTRGRFLRRLNLKGVGGQIHYIPLHRQPYQVERYGYRPENFPTADSYFQQCLSLPLYPSLTDEDVERVIRAVAEAVTLRDVA